MRLKRAQGEYLRTLSDVDDRDIEEDMKFPIYGFSKVFDEKIPIK